MPDNHGFGDLQAFQQIMGIGRQLLEAVLVIVSLSTPCTISLALLSASLCVILSHARNAALVFFECFRKCAADCQSKTSFFSTTCQIFIIDPPQTSWNLLITLPISVDFVIAVESKRVYAIGRAYCTYR